MLILKLKEINLMEKELKKQLESNDTQNKQQSDANREENLVNKDNFEQVSQELTKEIVQELKLEKELIF